MEKGWLLRDVEVDGAITDCRLGGGLVRQCAPGLPPSPGERVLHARGGALRPGMRAHLPDPPSDDKLGARLAAYGVTHVTSGASTVERLRAGLPQHVAFDDPERVDGWDENPWHMPFPRPHPVAPGRAADLCVLDRSLRQVLAAPRDGAQAVVATFVSGRLIHRREHLSGLIRIG